MNIEVLKALEEIKQMIIDGDKELKKEIMEYIEEKSKTKKVKSTKKDGD